MENFVDNYTIFGLLGLLIYVFYLIVGIFCLVGKFNVSLVLLLSSSAPSVLFTCAAIHHLKSISNYADRNDIFNTVGMATWVGQLNLLSVVAMISLWLLYGCCIYSHRKGRAV